jgi:hypothetical protein
LPIVRAVSRPIGSRLYIDTEGIVALRELDEGEEVESIEQTAQP